MAYKTYSDKLLDPRWQKKRLEILNRDDFTCTRCGDTKSTLHVHHNSDKGNPWEVENEMLTTVCKNCHEDEHAKDIVDTTSLDYKQLEKTRQYGTDTHDNQGRLKYHKDNPDYPPIYKNGWNSPPDVLYAKELLWLEYPNENNEYPDIAAIVQSDYKFMLKIRNMTEVEYKASIASFNITETKEEYEKSLQEPFHYTCNNWGVVIIDEGITYGDSEKNIQYF